MNETLQALTASPAAHERSPLSARTVLSRAAMSWRVTDSGGTWLELLVRSRPDGARIAQSIVLVEEHESGWAVVNSGELTELDVRELLADVAKWACGKPHLNFFELEIA